MEVGPLEALCLLLDDGRDVVGDDDDLAVPELLHELALEVLHELAVLYLEDLLAVVEDYDGVGLALLRELLELAHFLGDEVLLLEAQLQQGLDVAPVLVLEVHCEVLREDLAVHHVDARLFHEVGLAREPLPLEEKVGDALVVGEVLLDEGKHLALHAQDVVLAQALGGRPPLVVVELLLAVAEEVLALLVGKGLLGEDAELPPLTRPPDLAGVAAGPAQPLVLPLLVLDDLALDLVEELAHGLPPLEQPHVELPREALAVHVAGLLVVADADDVLAAADALGQRVREAHVEDDQLGQGGADVQQVHELLVLQVQQLPDRGLALDLQVPVGLLAVAREVEHRGAVEERVLDVGLGGHHHLDPEILLKLLLLDEFDELVVLELVADLVVDGDLVLLRDRDQRVSEEVGDINGADALLAALLLLLALLYNAVDVAVEPVELLRVAVEELQQVLLVLDVLQQDPDLEEAALVEREVDVGGVSAQFVEVLLAVGGEHPDVEVVGHDVVLLAQESVYVPQDGLDAQPRLAVLEVVVQGVLSLPRAQTYLQVQSLCHAIIKEKGDGAITGWDCLSIWRCLARDRGRI